MTEVDNMNTNENRAVVFGRPEGTNDTATRIAYEAADGERRVWVPKQAVESRIICADGERTAYVMRTVDIEGNTFEPSAVFAGELSPLPPTSVNDIEFVDAVEQGVAEANLRHLVSEQKTRNEETLAGVQQATQEATGGGLTLPTGGLTLPPSALVEDIDDEPVTLTLDEQDIASGYTPGGDEHGVQSTVSIDSDENDDSTPVFAPSSAGSGQVQTTTPGDSENITSTAWGGALLSGGRERSVVPWRYTPQKVPGYIMVQADAESAPVPVRVNKDNGNPAAFHIMNPELANDSMPGGACLGTVSDAYHLLPHTTVFDPIMKWADQEGLKTHVTSYNNGAKARLDLDVSQAAQSRKIAAERNKAAGHKWLDTSTHGSMIDKLDGLYKYGFAIHNSVDGSGALSVQGQALRVYCNNLASMGGIDTVLRLRHNNGIMADIDWNKFGETVVNATAELQAWLVNQELLAHLPLDVQLFDKLSVAASKLNILSLPTVKVEDETTGKFSLQRGYLWRVISSGYVNGHTGASGADLPFVKVNREQNGTAYHALQCYTGAITHKPEWSSADGKQSMAGNVLSLEGTTKKLQTINDMFTGLCDSAYEAYMESTGADALTVADMPKVAQFVTENPHVLKVGLGNNRSKALVDIPTVEESLLVV